MSETVMEMLSVVWQDAHLARAAGITACFAGVGLPARAQGITGQFNKRAEFSGGGYFSSQGACILIGSQQLPIPSCAKALDCVPNNGFAFQIKGDFPAMTFAIDRLVFRHHLPRQRRGQRSGRPPRIEYLEPRTLLSVQFTPAPYAVPGSRPDTPLTQMSSARPVEPYVSLNNQDPGQVAVSSQNGVRATTNDGGNFLGTATFPGSTGGDTSTTYDGAGRLFWINLTMNGIGIAQINPTTGRIIPSTSHPVDTRFGDDKDFIAADPATNNLYVTWTVISPATGVTSVLLTRSTDQGAHWSAPVRVDDGSDGFVWPATVTVAPDGHVFAAFHSQLDFGAPGSEGTGNPGGMTGTIVVVRYNNDLTSPLRTLAFPPGGADVTFNFQTAPTRLIPQAQFVTLGSAQGWILADPVRPGNIYVIAADGNHVDPSDYGDIKIARSTDDGQTWTSSFIDVGSRNIFRLFPTAAIDPFGDILVCYYDNRRGRVNSSGRYELDVYGSYSTDGGLTFAPPFQINDPSNPFDPDQGAVNYFNGPPTTTRIGEYFGTALFGDTAYVAWNGNSTSTGEQVWFKAIAIPGALTVTGTGGDDSITIRPLPGNADFAEILVNGQQQYTGLWSGLTAITVTATSGNDTINIEGTPAGVPVTVNLGDGSDTVNLSPVAQNLSNLAGPMTINGGSGRDTLNLFDEGINSNQNYTVSSSTIARSGMGTVTYQNVSNIVLNTGNGTDTITVQSTPAGTAVAINGGTGTNTLLGSAVDNAWILTGTNAGTLSSTSIAGLVSFTSVQNLTGGAAGNSFVFSDGAHISGNLDGGSGGGSLDYSAYSSSVIVDLQTATATGVGGTIANIQNITGGSGGGAGVYNILVGDGGNTLAGGTGRRNLLIAGSSASTLLAGDDEDILIAGTTAYDMDVASLMAIMAYWSGTSDDYATRVANLMSGNGVPLLDATTVTGNNGGNIMTGTGALALIYTDGLDSIGGFDPDSQLVTIVP
jgi:hypothetical protein